MSLAAAGLGGAPQPSPFDICCHRRRHIVTRVALIDLIAKRQICHPTSVTSVTSSSAFLVPTVPNRYEALSAASSKKQAVAHNVVTSSIAPIVPREQLLVELAGSMFLCESATAELSA
jgi:hypothetical protein